MVTLFPFLKRWLRSLAAFLPFAPSVLRGHCRCSIACLALLTTRARGNADGLCPNGFCFDRVLLSLVSVSCCKSSHLLRCFHCRPAGWALKIVAQGLDSLKRSLTAAASSTEIVNNRRLCTCLLRNRTCRICHWKGIASMVHEVVSLQSGTRPDPEARASC